MGASIWTKFGGRDAEKCQDYGQIVEIDHNTKVAQITSTVKRWIEADPRIQAGVSFTCTDRSRAPVTSQVPHTS